MHAYSANFNMLVQDISYLKFSQTFLHKLSNWRLYSAMGQFKQNAAVEQISEVLTRQFCSALPVSLPKQTYHRYLSLFRHLASLTYFGLMGLQTSNTKLSLSMAQ